MHFIYIDDSGERNIRIYSAIAVPAMYWNETFQNIKAWRSMLKKDHGIPMNYELHATKFVRGKGRGAPGLERRSAIFNSAFDLLNKQKGLGIFNVCFDNRNSERAFERLLNRINRTMAAKNSYAHLICDEGDEAKYVKMYRRMRITNHIPSRYGVWEESGQHTENIPLDRIIEDPAFKKSDESYFIQMADFVAYGLLRRELVTGSGNPHDIHLAFDRLSTNRCVLAANRKDPMGVIRN